MLEIGTAQDKSKTRRSNSQVFTSCPGQARRDREFMFHALPKTRGRHGKIKFASGPSCPGQRGRDMSKLNSWAFTRSKTRRLNSQVFTVAQDASKTRDQLQEDKVQVRTEFDKRDKLQVPRKRRTSRKRSVLHASYTSPLRYARGTRRGSKRITRELHPWHGPKQRRRET